MADSAEAGFGIRGDDLDSRPVAQSNVEVLFHTVNNRYQRLRCESRTDRRSQISSRRPDAELSLGAVEQFHRDRVTHRPPTIPSPLGPQVALFADHGAP